MKRYLGLLQIIGALITAGGIVFAAVDHSRGSSVRVIDGDTIEVAGQRVRLWGIDAPETDQICDGAAIGQEAKRQMLDIIGRQGVDCLAIDHDRYGRIVAVCKAGGVDIGGELVRRGWAWDWATFSKGAYRDEQDEAEENRRGVWQSSCTMPWDWRKRNRAP